MFTTNLPEPPLPAWTWQSSLSQLQRCPICEGRGTLPVGFREGRDDPTAREICADCGGRGMLLVNPGGTVSKLPSWQPL